MPGFIKHQRDIVQEIGKGTQQRMIEQGRFVAMIDELITMDLSNRDGHVDANSPEFGRLKLSKGELASMWGTSFQSVDRQLTRWEGTRYLTRKLPGSTAGSDPEVTRKLGHNLFISDYTMFNGFDSVARKLPGSKPEPHPEVDRNLTRKLPIDCNLDRVFDNTRTMKNKEKEENCPQPEAGDCVTEILDLDVNVTVPENTDKTGYYDAKGFWVPATGKKEIDAELTSWARMVIWHHQRWALDNCLWRPVEPDNFGIAVKMVKDKIKSEGNGDFVKGTQIMLAVIEESVESFMFNQDNEMENPTFRRIMTNYKFEALMNAVGKKAKKPGFWEQNYPLREISPFDVEKKIYEALKRAKQRKLFRDGMKASFELTGSMPSNWRKFLSKQQQSEITDSGKVIEDLPLSDEKILEDWEVAEKFKR